MNLTEYFIQELTKSKSLYEIQNTMIVSQYKPNNNIMCLNSSNIDGGVLGFWGIVGQTFGKFSIIQPLFLQKT